MNYPLKEILLPRSDNTVKDEAQMEALWGDYNYIVEEKYYRSRYVSVSSMFFFHKISKKTGFPVEKTDHLPHLSFVTKYPMSILDGEVYFEGMCSNDVTKIMEAEPEKAIPRQKEDDCSGIIEEISGNNTANPNNYLGQVMDMEVTKGSFYRYPQFSRFRDDKNVRDCIVGGN